MDVPPTLNQSEHDQRQIRLMRQHLVQFERGDIEVSRLLRDLKALLASLEVKDVAWDADFRNAWGTIETIYALALQRKERGSIDNIKSVIDEQSNRYLVTDAISTLLRLVQEREVLGDGKTG